MKKVTSIATVHHSYIAMGVPAELDESGLTKIIEFKLHSEEQAEFLRSAEMVQADISTLPH